MLGKTIEKSTFACVFCFIVDLFTNSRRLCIILKEEEISIGVTLTCEQLVKQKFDHAAKNGYIIAIDI